MATTYDPAAEGARAAQRDNAPARRLEEIAAEHLFVDTLETRRSDSLDFHDVSVWGIRRALEAAYAAGRAAAAKTITAHLAVDYNGPLAAARAAQDDARAQLAKAEADPGANGAPGDVDLFDDLFTACPACRAGRYDHSGLCPRPATPGGQCPPAASGEARAER